MKINISLTALANVYSLVNAANALTLNATKATVGIPSARTPGANPHNTSLVLTAVDGGGYVSGSSVTVTYNRLGMGSGVAAPDFNFITNAATDASNFKTTVAAQLGLIESEIELTGTLPAIGEEVTMVIAAKTDSLVYTGTQNITVTRPEAPKLDDIIITEYLGAF